MKPVPVATALESRTRQSFQYSREIQKPYGELEKVLEWCKDELYREWRWQLIETSGSNSPGRYCFYFDDELEFTAFLLKWS